MAKKKTTKKPAGNKRGKPAKKTIKKAVVKAKKTKIKKAKATKKSKPARKAVAVKKKVAPKKAKKTASSKKSKVAKKAIHKSVAPKKSSVKNKTAKAKTKKNTKPVNKTAAKSKPVRSSGKKVVAKSVHTTVAKTTVKKSVVKKSKPVLAEKNNISINIKPAAPIKTQPKGVSEKLADAVVEGILEKKGTKISVLNLSKIQNRVCDIFIICQADSRTQVNAIADSVIETVKKLTGERPYRSEGFENSEWILIDYVNVVTHVFQSEIRDFYNLEGLWADAEETKIAYN